MSLKEPLVIKAVDQALAAADNEPDNPMGQIRAVLESINSTFKQHSSNPMTSGHESDLGSALNKDQLDPISANLLFQIAAAEYGFRTNLAVFARKNSDGTTNAHIFTTFVNPETGGKMACDPTIPVAIKTFTEFAKDNGLQFLGNNTVYQENKVIAIDDY